MWATMYYVYIFCWSSILLLIPRTIGTREGKLTGTKEVDTAPAASDDGSFARVKHIAKQRWTSFCKQWRSGKLVRLAVLTVGIVWYSCLLYYYLKHIEYSTGSSANQPHPNVYHLTSGVWFGGTLAVLAVLLSGATGAYFRWPATALLAPFYFLLLCEKVAVANKSLRVSQGASRQWLVHGVWLGTATAPFVLVSYWGLADLRRNEHFRGYSEEAGSWWQQLLLSLAAKKAEEKTVSTTEERRPLVTILDDGQYRISQPPADGGDDVETAGRDPAVSSASSVTSPSRSSSLVIVDSDGVPTSASTLLAHSTHGAGLGGWMNKTAAGRWWRRHGALVLMSALLLYDLWISAYPARVETVSGAYTQYDSFFGLSLPETVQCAGTHAAAGAAEWVLKDYSSGNSAPWDSSRPNVLWVLHDDLRASWGKPYEQSHTLTPNINDLSESSFVFDQAYCQIAVCGPSRSSLLTGRRPDVIRSYSFETNFRGASSGLNGHAHEDERGTGRRDLTLPQLFKSNGYLTTGTGKVFHEGEPAMGDPISWSCEMAYLDHGQQKCLASGTAKNSDMETLLRDHAIETNHYCTLGDEGTVLVDEQATRRTLHAVDQAMRLKRPFFAVAGLRGMHGDYAVPQRYLEKYFEQSSATPFDETEFWSKIDAVVNFPTDAPSLADSHYDWSVANHTNYNLTAIWRLYYRATVTYADALVGSMVDKLEKHDLVDSTIVILSSDHGVHLGEQGMSSKQTNYEAATRVPLLIRAPMLKTLTSMQRVGGFAENVDIFPTLASIAGLDYDHSSLDGHSLVSAMKNDDSAKGYALSQYMRCANDGDWICTSSLDADITQMGYSLRVSGWRYTEWFNWNHPSSEADWEHPVAKELYRYSKDETAAFGDYNDFESVNLLGDSTAAVLEKASDLAEELRTRFKNFTTVL